ncbi:NAD-dependent epimerase/dehydratase family protein [Devosia sp. ZB163]|uniref:NAD-dependent epimerase/dehydratase family protein n=1 Tax=Devosia sp. ZB163 TaxID=3025938 RepID=UPI00235E65FD|nr:NAD-dependent epimerase/dehydratase family protein [Devosia sp. ZB163]MDC9823054.1 NAD-dependent epimerase/dehydratase family protein [Devosia sp. ZB163]
MAITGSTGFVGRHVVARMIAMRRNVTLLVQSARKCPASWRDHAQIRIVETGPIEQSTQLAVALEDAATVVHLGGLAHVKSADPARYMAANVEATKRLAVASIDAGVQGFLLLSSIAAVTENAAPGRISEATRPRPAGPYGLSKRMAEEHVAVLAAHGIFAVSLRPPLVVGADAPGNWRSLQRLALTGAPLPFGSTSNRRAYIGVDTLAEMLDHLANHAWSHERSGAYCVANAENLSLAEVLSLLRKAMGKQQALFPMPTQLLNGPLILLGRRRLAQSLFGDLDIDSSAFQSTFAFSESMGIREAIHKSGSEFALSN